MTTIHIIDRRKEKPILTQTVRIFLGSALFASVFFGPGLLANSAAMQWAGFIIFMGLIYLGMVGYSASKLTIPEARKKLDELEAKTNDK